MFDGGVNGLDVPPGLAACPGPATVPLGLNLGVPGNGFGFIVPPGLAACPGPATVPLGLNRVGGTLLLAGGLAASKPS